MKPKIEYDSKVNIFSIKLSNKKSVDSDVQKNVVVDYSKDGEIINIEVMGIDINEFTDLSLLSSHPLYHQVGILRDKNR